MTEEAHRKPPTGVVKQGRVSKTGVKPFCLQNEPAKFYSKTMQAHFRRQNSFTSGSGIELTAARHAPEALQHIQELVGPPPTSYEEAALILILTLHSWTWNHTISVHDKTGPPYARTGKCRPTTASAGEVH